MTAKRGQISSKFAKFCQIWKLLQQRKEWKCVPPWPLQECSEHIAFENFHRVGELLFRLFYNILVILVYHFSLFPFIPGLRGVSYVIWVVFGQNHQIWEKLIFFVTGEQNQKVFCPKQLQNSKIFAELFWQRMKCGVGGYQRHGVSWTGRGTPPPPHPLPTLWKYRKSQNKGPDFFWD